MREIPENLKPTNPPEDRKNAREFLNGKIAIEVAKNQTQVQMEGWRFNLPPIRPEMSGLLQSLIETLTVEKSVCEARLHLLEECKATVGSTHKINEAFGGGPDIFFSESFLRTSQRIMSYELLGRIFQQKNDRPLSLEKISEIASTITIFANSLPRNFIPRELIEIGPNAQLKKEKTAKK